ncbi:MAG: hypothetical protein WCT03_06740 [Candidatus Obscuribacterales bacterium]|jgi:hypothetical protein
MIQDIIRALFEKIIHDKILMALIAIGIAGIFFSGANHSEKSESVQSKRLGRSSADQPAATGEQQGGDGPVQGQAPQAGQPAGQAGQGQASGQAQVAAGTAATPAAGAGQAAAQPLTPDLALQFVRWWLTQSMDYRMDTAAASHKTAALWMLPDANNAFEQLYWGDHIKQGIASGQIVGAFQPVSVTPVATNPDGSVVVTAVGTLMIQQSGQQPAGQQLTMDFLVKQTGDGLRIAAFFNRAVAPVAVH